MLIHYRFPYFHIALILLLSIVFIPPAFAIEARYVKIVIDPVSNPDVSIIASFNSFNVHLFDVDGQRVDDPITGVQRFVGSNPHHIGIYFGVSPEFAFVDIWVGAYYCPFSFDCWVMVDLRQVMDIAKVELFTNEAFTSEFYNYGSGVNTSLVVFPVTDYRILVSNNNLDWTLAAVVTDQPATTRTDTITLEDLGGGMDIDINYVVALFLAIIFLGFFRQIFF